MEDINYEEIFNKTYIYYNESLKKEFEDIYSVYINHSILYNLVLDLIIAEKCNHVLYLTKQQIRFIYNNNIDLESLVVKFSNNI